MRLALSWASSGDIKLTGKRPSWRIFALLICISFNWNNFCNNTLLRSFSLYYFELIFFCNITLLLIQKRTFRTCIPCILFYTRGNTFLIKTYNLIKNKCSLIRSLSNDYCQNLQDYLNVLNYLFQSLVFNFYFNGNQIFRQTL